MYLAMGRHDRVFDELAVSTVRAGEEGGFLEDVLKRIAEHPAQRLDELLPWNWKAEQLQKAA